MKKITLFLFCGSMLFAVAQHQSGEGSKDKKLASLSKPNKAGGYGAVITTEKAVSLAEVETEMHRLKKDEAENVKVKGTVMSVCKAKGCWMGIDNGKGQSVRVRFKDYSFFVPRDCEGQTVYAVGTARFDTTSVEMLRHYAADAGKSKAEIDAIQTPTVELTFEASGVLFEKK
ncbi:MAG: DUF4920 domain-containing protein [Chitinophagales bacterium]